MMIIMYVIILHKALLAFSSTKTFISHFNPSPIRYGDKPLFRDLFYDRILSVTLDIKDYKGQGKKHSQIAIAVLIDNNRILTSYNAFREVIQSAELLQKIWVCFLKSRQVGPGDIDRIRYRTLCSQIKCGRPVVPMLDSEILRDQWHGLDRKHSPLHDLMVLQLEVSARMHTPPSDFYTFEEIYIPEYVANGTWVTTGPILTTLANATDEMTREIRFASLGIYTYAAAVAYFSIHAAKYDDRNIVVVNCDEWLPRDWGYFICLWNDEIFSGFGSGSLLFSGSKLFGIGSFALWRGKQSILVFTDIRPYLEHIKYTCTDHDLV